MKKKLYITVDTECHDINNQDRYIWGETIDGERWGLEKILEEGKTLNIPINFFVDIAEADRYGIEFIRNIIHIIQSYNQPVFLHLHPNYITGDENRTYLWEYNEDEQKKILSRAHQIWDELFPKTACVAFRAGRYGTDAKIYPLLKKEFGDGLIDLSYGAPGGKMCHLTKKDVGIDNICREYNGIILFPNTVYVGLKLFGKSYNFSLDAAQTCVGEFKSVVRQNNLSNLILTMHSWNFIKTWFFKKGKVYKDTSALRRFRSMVAFAQQEGYEISNLNDFELTIDENDQLVDICGSMFGKIRAFEYNFFRFQRMARLSPKYFKIYTLFYFFVVVFVAIVLYFIFCNFCK
jgi:hypothetical protein